MPFEQVGRRRPAPGVHIFAGEPTIVFLTVCTRDRKAWLDHDGVHETLQRVWQTADAWLVGYYLLMPDHIHLFCAPRDLRLTLESWLKFWQSRFSKTHQKSGATLPVRRLSSSSAPAGELHRKMGLRANESGPARIGGKAGGLEISRIVESFAMVIRCVPFSKKCQGSAGASPYL